MGAAPTLGDALTVIIGVALDQLGLAQRRYLARGSALRDRLEGRTRSWATPSTALRSYQPASRVNVAHDASLAFGHVAWLERDYNLRCWAVCATEHTIPPDHRLRFYSVETDAKRDGTDVVLTGIALVDRTAQTGVGEVTILPGQLTDYRRPDARRRLEPVLAEVLGHAAHRGVRRGEGLQVHDLRPPSVEQLGRGLAVVDDQLVNVGPSGRPPGVMRHGMPGAVISVR
jgi:hypothetical protein